MTDDDSPAQAAVNSSTTPITVTPSTSTPIDDTSSSTSNNPTTLPPATSTSKPTAKTAAKPSSKASIPPSTTTTTSSSRTKTFTGCWTCRARKIKCDLRRPTCFRCEKAKVECAGYSIKLRWSSSNAKGESKDPTSTKHGTTKDATVEYDFFQRRNVEFVQYPPHMVYEYYEDMDVILSKLHSPKIQGDETKVLGPFGVFQGVKNTRRRLATSKKSKRRRLSPETPGIIKSSTIDTSPLSSNSPSSAHASPRDVQSRTSQSPLVTLLGNNNNKSLPQDTSLATIAKNDHPILQDPVDDPLFALDNMPIINDFGEKHNLPEFNTNMFHSEELLNTFSDHHDTMFNIEGMLANPMFLEEDKPSEHEPTDLEIPIAEEEDPAQHSDLFLSLSGPNINHYLSQDLGLGLPTNSQYFQPQSRYLLNHYIKSVARVMTVVAHEKTAWKTIYLPRAISAIGELVGLGSCSNPRRSLLHALLSISSFHLASKLPPNSDQKSHYTSLGISLKNQALQSLHHCLQSDALTSLKHKDIMTAMLSMVTIDVVSGETKECSFHLKGCKHLVSIRRQSGRRISKKALVLHRISSFLCLMQDATTLNPELMDSLAIDNRSWDDFAEIAELGLGSPDSYTRNFNTKGKIEAAVDIDFRNNSNSLSSVSSELQESAEYLESLSHIQSESQLREYWNQYSTDIPQNIETFYDNELVSTHSMYCIPDSLTLLFSRTVKLARQVCYMRWKKQRITKATVEKCNYLQRSLRQWGEWYSEARLPVEFTGDVRTAIDHHTSAFYFSLLIYHYTNVREINPASLQGFVNSVLDHLNALLALNTDSSNPLIIPLLFPAFVAACEALSKETQQKFDDFFNRLTIQGLGTYYQARFVVNEVWRRRAENDERAAWRFVLQDEGVNVMLS